MTLDLAVQSIQISVNPQDPWHMRVGDVSYAHMEKIRILEETCTPLGLYPSHYIRVDYLIISILIQFKFLNYSYLNDTSS